MWVRGQFMQDLGGPGSSLGLIHRDSQPFTKVFSIFGCAGSSMLHEGFQGLLFVAGRGLLTAVASLVEHGLSRAQVQ